MKYLFEDTYAKHWLDITKMLEENYNEEIKDSSVVVGACAKRPFSDFKALSEGRKVIVYQLEPLVNNHWHLPENIITNIKDADEVWDYDLDNIAILKSFGIDAKHKPCLYTHALKKIENVADPDIDVLFYGTMTERRSRFFSEAFYKAIIPYEQVSILTDMSTVMLNQVWGDQLDHFISRSKIILNLNPYDGDCRQQQTRIFYSLINNKCVISERSSRNYFGGLIREFSDPQEFILLAGELLTGDKWRDYTKSDFEGYSNTIRHYLKDK